MAPEFQAVVRATQAWLQTTWHVQVPFAWLEACVAWLQEEAGGAGHLSQLQINQQVGRRSDQMVCGTWRWGILATDVKVSCPSSWPI